MSESKTSDLNVERIQGITSSVYSERSNVSSTVFDVKKCHEHNFSFIWTQKYHF